MKAENKESIRKYLKKNILQIYRASGASPISSLRSFNFLAREFAERKGCENIFSYK